MTEDGSDPAARDEDGLEPVIGWPWRVVAAVLAAGALILGTLAIFWTDVEAGPVALLAIGLIFSLIAMAGHMPWRIKFGDNEIELRRERAKTSTLEHAAVDIAAVAPKSAQAALEPAIERLEAASPSTGEAVRRALGFEEEVFELLRTACEGTSIVLTEGSVKPDVAFDATLESADTSEVAIVTVKARSLISADEIRNAYERLPWASHRLGRTPVGLLFVAPAGPILGSVSGFLRGHPDLYYFQVTGKNDVTRLRSMIDSMFPE